MKIIFLGDVMLGRLVNNLLKRVPPGYPWGDTLSVLRQADLRICNLECVLSDKGRPWGSKAFYFRTDAKNIAALKAADINMVSLANNHSCDFGYDAMEEMLAILDKSNISRAGAGLNIEEAQRPAVLESCGVRIGFVSFTDNEPGWEAGPNTPGIFYVPINLDDRRAQGLLNIIRELKKRTDLVIAAAHWGPNRGYRPPDGHTPFARALVEAGADIIFGHSAHIFRGIEICKERPILYSTGDFVDDYAVDEVERNDESFIFLCEAEKNKIVGLRLFPTIIRHFHAELVKESMAESVAVKMRLLCREFGTEALWRKKKNYIEILIK